MSSISAKAYIINPSFESSYSDEIDGISSISNEIEDLYSEAISLSTSPIKKIDNLLRIVKMKNLKRLDVYMVQGLWATGLLTRVDNEYIVSKYNKYVEPSKLSVTELSYLVGIFSVAYTNPEYADIFDFKFGSQDEIFLLDTDLNKVYLVRFMNFLGITQTSHLSSRHKHKCTFTPFGKEFLNEFQSAHNNTSPDNTVISENSSVDELSNVGSGKLTLLGRLSISYLRFKVFIRTSLSWLMQRFMDSINLIIGSLITITLLIVIFKFVVPLIPQDWKNFYKTGGLYVKGRLEFYFPDLF